MFKGFKLKSDSINFVFQIRLRPSSLTSSRKCAAAFQFRYRIDPICMFKGFKLKSDSINFVFQIRLRLKIISDHSLDCFGMSFHNTRCSSIFIEKCKTNYFTFLRTSGINLIGLKPVVTLSGPRHRGAGAEDSSTTPVEPESARQLGGNSGGPPCSHGADARGGTASPFVPHDAVTTPGVDPTVRTRSPAGPRGRHVTPPAAAQRPAGPRSVGATSVWRGEPRTKSIGSASGCREGELVGPEASASTTSARLGELVRARSNWSPRRPLDLKGGPERPEPAKST